MIHYAGLKKNDATNTESGICVSFWTQGCEEKCYQCHNPETWDKCGGKIIEIDDLVSQIIEAIPANNIQRNFSVLGGDPCTEYNIDTTEYVCGEVRKHFPHIKIYLWTGYLFKDIPDKIKNIVDIIIDGPFILKEKDLSLKLRGSRNQHIYKKDFAGAWYMEE